MKHYTPFDCTVGFRPRVSISWLSFLTALIIGLATRPVLAIGRYWTGSVSGYWSNPNNWSPVGVPQEGDGLYFRNGSNTSMVNDLPNLTVSYLDFQLYDYDLNGNSLTLTSGGNPINNGGGIYGTFGYEAASHTTTINCPLVLANGGLIFSGGDSGLFTSDTDNLYLNGSITISNRTIFESLTDNSFPGGTGHLYVSGPISGSPQYSILVDADGDDSSVEFIGPQVNSFDGTVNLLTYGNGQIVFNKTLGAVVSRHVAVGTGATAKLNLAGPNQFPSDATITILAGAQLVLSGNNATVGSLVLTNLSGDTTPSILDTGTTTLALNGGITSWSSNNSVVPVIKGRLSLNSLVSFNIGGSAFAGLDMQAQIAGPGGFSKSGNAAMILQASNTFVGDVLVNEGILEVRNNDALGATSRGTFLTGNGSLTLRNVSIAFETLYVRGNQPLTAETTGSLLFTIGTCVWGGAVVLDTNLVVQADIVSLNGPIMGSAGLDFRNGTAILGASAGNTYTGTTLVRCQLLEFNKPSGVNAFVGPLVVGGGFGGTCEARWLNSYQNVGAKATLYANGIINLNNHNEDFGPVTFNGGEVDTGTGQFAIYAPVTVNPAPTSAVINGYLGLPPGDDRVFIVGDGAADCDLLVNAVVFGSPTGHYFVKQGPGTMCLANANSFDAPTLLEEGILDINNGAGLGTWPGLVIFNGATLRLSGSGSAPGGFEIVGAGVGGIHGAIEVLPNTSFSFAGGLLLDAATTFNVGLSGGLGLYGSISGNGPLVKAGKGNLVLGGSANNTYAGDTIVLAGGLQIAKTAGVIAVPNNLVVGPGPVGTFAQYLQSGGLGGTTVTINANSLLDLNGYNQSLNRLNLNDGGILKTGTGTLSLPNGASVGVGSLSLLGSRGTASIIGNVALPLNGSVTMSVDPFLQALVFGPELEVPAAISGPAFSAFATLLIKEGAGQMRLSGNNTFRGTLEINSGAVIAASATALGSTFGGTFVNSNGALIVDGGIAINNEAVTLDSSRLPALESRNGANSWSGAIHLNRDSNIGVTSASDNLLVTGQVDGAGALAKIGFGTLTFGGSANNTYAGDTFVNSGTLVLQRSAGVTAIPQHVIVGAANGTPGALLEQSGFNINGSVTVNSGGLWDLTGQAEGFSLSSLGGRPPLTINGGGVVQTGPSGIIYLPAGGDIVANPGPIAGGAVLGNLGLDAGTHHFTVNGNPVVPGVYGLNVPAIIGQTSGGVGLIKDGSGSLRFAAANTYSGGTVVAAGLLQVDGAQPQSPIQVNGTARLQGFGTVGHITYNGSSGVVAPGSSPGLLTCSNFNAGALGSGSLEVELNGLTPGTDYDQLNARGTVTLTGVTLNSSLHFSSAVGSQFIIIQNDGADPVIGTFNGLPQNAKFYIAGELFQVNYSGGTGNDVVLTRLLTPPPPVLVIQRVPPSSVRLLWPTNDPAFNLQFATNLTSPNWSAASPTPVVSGTNNVVTNAIAGTQKFYRLITP